MKRVYTLEKPYLGYWLGKKRSKEDRLKMSLAKKGKYANEKNHMWKGNDVGYLALHAWIGRKYGKPSYCELCGSDNNKKRYHWANKTGRYNREFKNWIRLCASCHYRYDDIYKKRWKNHIKNSERICSKEGCSNIVHSSGLCNKHYLRKWRKNE